MTKPSFHFLAFAASALLSLAAVAPVAAQTDPTQPVQPVQPTTVVPPAETTTTVTVPAHEATVTVPAQTTTVTVPAQTTTVVTPVQPVPAVQPAPLAPGEHVAEIELAVSRGSVRAYFGRAPKGERVEIGSANFGIKLPSTMTVTKIASRDNDSDGASRVTPSNPWIARVVFSGPGRYVFNIVGWDDDPVVTAAILKVDGVVVFSGHGRQDDFDDWAERHYGPGVRKTGGREIAFNLD